MVLAESHVLLAVSVAALVESQAENGALKRARKEMESQSMLDTPVSSGTPPPVCGLGKQCVLDGLEAIHPLWAISRTIDSCRD